MFFGQFERYNYWNTALILASFIFTLIGYAIAVNVTVTKPDLTAGASVALCTIAWIFELAAFGLNAMRDVEGPKNLNNPNVSISQPPVLA